MTDSLLKEVDEALRADRTGALWNRYRLIVILLALALVFATAADSIWQHYRQQLGAQVMLRFNENQRLLKIGKADEAARGFDAIAAAQGGQLRELAQIWQARALVAAGNKSMAIAVLQRAADSGSNSLWSDIACMRLSGLDTVAATPCLTAGNDSPLRIERAQWAAGIAWGKGDSEAALSGIEQLIADPESSQKARAQLTQWLAVVKARKGNK